ncbi:MAG: hypothetical protein ABIO99_10705 [Candidatus Limnocylindria bacterium]
MPHTHALLRGASLAALLIIGAAASVVLAKDSLLDGKLRVGDTISIGAAESIDGDLYLIAGTVTMDGTVDGDLTVIGGQVTVNGTVTGDTLAAGGRVTLAGSIDGDLRTTGGQVTLSGDTGEDVLTAAGQAKVTSAGTIGGDLIVTGGDVQMDGSVDGNIEASGGAYNRTGTVGGTEHVIVGRADDDAPTTVPVDNAIGHFVALLILGGLAIWLLPGVVTAAESTLRTRPLLSLGGGLAAFVGYILFVIVAILLTVLLAIVFGILSLESILAVAIVAGVLTIGVISFLFVLAVAFGGDIVVALAIARVAGRGGFGAPWRQLTLFAIGAAVVVIATSLPIVGGIVKLAVVVFGLGALIVVAYRAWWPRRRSSEVVA